MKKGFTLAEVLVALGLVGIIAAITAPMLGSMMPNEHKAKALKYYKTVQDINQELLSNPFYYYDYKDGNVTKLGLASYGTADKFPGLKEEVGDDYNNYLGNKKYCYLLANKMEVDGDIQNYTSNIEFETIDGVSITCSPGKSVLNHSLKEQPYTLTFDINGDNAPNNIGTKNQKKPDRFVFHIDTYGKVTADSKDKLTQQYLKNPHKLNDKKADYEAAFGS